MCAHDLLYYSFGLRITVFQHRTLLFLPRVWWMSQLYFVEIGLSESSTHAHHSPHQVIVLHSAPTSPTILLPLAFPPLLCPQESKTGSIPPLKIPRSFKPFLQSLVEYSSIRCLPVLHRLCSCYEPYIQFICHCLGSRPWSHHSGRIPLHFNFVQQFYTSIDYTCKTRRTFQYSVAKNKAWCQSDTPKTHYTPFHCFSIMYFLRWTYLFILYFYRGGISFWYSMPALNSCSLLSQIVKGCFIQQTRHS